MPQPVVNTNKSMKFFSIENINKRIFLYIFIYLSLILSLSLIGKAFAKTYHFPEERYEAWSLGIMHTEHQHKVVSERLNQKLKTGFIHFSESATPWEITICTDKAPRNKLDTSHMHFESPSFVVKTTTSKNHVLTTYEPSSVKSGYIEIDSVAINTCSYMKVGGITYHLKHAEPVKEQITEPISKSMPLKARIKMVDTLGDEYELSNYPKSEAENFDPPSRDPWSDHHNDYPDWRPFPFHPTMPEKQINENIMLEMMGRVFGADEVLQWFNHWRNFFHARFFPEQAESYAREELSHFFVNIYSTIIGNHHQLKEKTNQSNKATEEKDHPEIVYRMTQTGEKKPFVRIISQDINGTKLENFIPAYLSVWNHEESIYKEISTESIRKMVNIFNPKTCDNSSPEMDDTFIFLLMVLAKNIYWLTDLTGVDPIPFTVKDWDNHVEKASSSRETTEFTLSEDSYSKYMQNLKIFMKNRKKIEIQGDGQCFFRSVGKAVYKRAINDDEISKMRRQMADFLEQSRFKPVDKNGAKILRQRDQNHLEELLRNLQNPNAWGEMELLPLVAEFFEEEIYFVTPAHTGDIQFTRANPDGSVNQIERNQIRSTQFVIYHDGIAHWGVSEIEGEPMDGGEDSPVQGTSTQRTATVSSDLSTSNTHNKYGYHNRNKNNDRDGGDSPDPRNRDDFRTDHYMGKTHLQRLDAVREVDEEFADHIQKMHSRVPEEFIHYLQEYVDQLDHLFMNCQYDSTRVYSDQAACDLKWVLTQNLKTVQVINGHLFETGSSSEDMETILKILVLQNLIADYIPIRGARAIMMLFHEKIPYADNISSAEDTDTETVKNNQKLIKDLIHYLYSHLSITIDITEFRPRQPADLLKFNLKKALLKVSPILTTDNTMAGDLFHSEHSDTFLLMQSTCEVIDILFSLSKQSLNTATKKIRKHFVTEEKTTRLEREQIEVIVYSQSLQLLLRKVSIEGIIIDRIVEKHDLTPPPQDKPSILDKSLTTLEEVKQYLAEISDAVTQIPKRVKQKLRQSYPSEKDDTVHLFSKMIPVGDFNHLMETQFNILYFLDYCKMADCIPLTIERGYTIGLLSTMKLELKELVLPDAYHHDLLHNKFTAEANALMWNMSWKTSEEGSNPLVNLIIITRKVKEAQRLNRLLFTTSKLPAQLKFAKSLAVQTHFTHDLFPEELQIPFLEHAESTIDTFKHIAESEYGSTNDRDLDFFREALVAEMDTGCINIEEWELKFVESVLLQHATESKHTAPQRISLDKLLTRDLKSPSLLGSLFLKLGKAVSGKLCTKAFHEVSHDFEKILTHQTLDHITPELWGRGSTWVFTGNHMHEPHARHNSNGVLQHSVPFIDKALRNPENLQNWYTLINLVLGETQANLHLPINEQRLVADLFDQPSENQGKLKKLHSLTIAKRSSFLDLIKRKSKSIEHGRHYIFEIVLDVCMAVDNNYCDIVESLLKHQLSKEYQRSMETITETSVQRHTVSVDSTDLPTVLLPPEMVAFLKYFTYSFLKNITADDFRFQITPDGNSIQLMAEILALLNIPVIDINGHHTHLFKILDIGDEVMTTVENYFIRLSSEHYQQIGLLVGEHFLHISDETEELKPETRKSIEALRQDKDFSAFFHELRTFWENQDREDDSHPRTAEQFIDSLMTDINTLTQELESRKNEFERGLHPHSSSCPDLSSHHLYLDTVVTVQPGSSNPSQKWREEQLTQDLVVDMEDQQPTEPDISEESLFLSESAHVQTKISKLTHGQTEKCFHETEKMILTGKFIHKYLEQLKTLQESFQLEAIATEEEKEASKTKWVKAMEWLENHESTISFIYLSSSITAIYYRSFGDGLTGHYYPGGGRAPFATTIIGNFGIDFLLLGLSLSSVATQVSQAAGWNRDVSKKIEMNLKTRHFPFSVSELSPYFIDNFLLYYLNNQDTGAPRTFDESMKRNPYKVFTNFKDTFMDLLSMFCCRSSPLTEGCQCPGPFNYLGRAVSQGNRMIIRDTIRGGVEQLLLDYIQKVKNRRASSLVRLLGENTPKSMNNSWGVSVFQQIMAIAIHGVDGLIALTEVSDMALMQQAEQLLILSANAAERLFDDKPLSQYDMDRIVDMFGTSLAERLATQAPLPEPHYARNQRIAKGLRVLASALQTGAFGVMAYDLYFFLINSLTSLDGLVDGLCESSTSEKMPGAGKEDLECFLGKFADFRKSHPWLRFTTVALSKTSSNIAWFIDTLAASIEKGHNSYDEVMLGTLIAGILKNTILGPTERALQTFPDITPNTIGDVIGQFDTYLKEAVESTVQRMAPKAPLALSRVGRAMVMNAMRQQQGDLLRVHTALQDELRHLSENVGFGAMNAGAEMRYMLAKEELAKADPTSSTTFQDFKEKAMKKVTKSLPSIHSRGLKMEPEHVQPLENLKQLVQSFLDNTDNGKPLIPAIISLINALKPIDRAVVDSYIQQVMFPKKPASFSQESSLSDQEDSFWDETIRMYQIKKEEDKIRQMPMIEPVH